MNMQSSTKKNMGLDRDAIWAQLRDEARAAVRDEPLLGALIHAGLLHHDSLEAALAYRFSLKLASGEMIAAIAMSEPGVRVTVDHEPEGALSPMNPSRPEMRRVPGASGPPIR